jgi:hypothetical protein
VPQPSRPASSRAKRQRRARPVAPPQVFDGLEADARSARELLDDLAALVEAGLVAPVRDGAAVRYAAIDNPERLARR